MRLPYTLAGPEHRHLPGHRPRGRLLRLQAGPHDPLARRLPLQYGAAPAVRGLRPQRLGSRRPGARAPFALSPELPAGCASVRLGKSWIQEILDPGNRSYVATFHQSHDEVSRRTRPPRVKRVLRSLTLILLPCVARCCAAAQPAEWGATCRAAGDAGAGRLGTHSCLLDMLVRPDGDPRVLLLSGVLDIIKKLGIVCL